MFLECRQVTGVQLCTICHVNATFTFTHLGGLLSLLYWRDLEHAGILMDG